MKLIMGVCAVTWFSAIALADEDPIIDPPTVVTDGISPIAPANYSLTKHELGGSRRKWDISFFLKATAWTAQPRKL